MRKQIIAALLGASSLSAMEKLDSKYWIRYGQPEAKVQVVEYFSLSCPKCLEFFRTDFPNVKLDQVSWSFHPDPADILTLQAMICLEQLTESEKVAFFGALLEHLPKTAPNKRCLLMQTAMEAFGHPLPDLDKIEFLEKTEAFQEAFRFLKQEDVIKIIPVVEINGHIYKEYPSSRFLNETIASIQRSS